MRILITGATGLTGTALLRVLGDEHEIYALRRPGSGGLGPGAVRWIDQDLGGPVESRLPERIDAVVHLAQSRRYREFPGGAVDVFEVNSAATVRLLHYCCRAGGTRFVYASSGAIYPPGSRAVREEDVPKPGTFYAVSKLVGEQVVDQFRDILTVASLRFFFIYGPGQRDMLIPGLIERVRSGQPVPIAGEEGIRINPVYVEDAAAAVRGALGIDRSSVFNVAGPDVISIRGIATVIGGEIGVEPRFTHWPAQPDLVADTQRMREHLTTPKIGIHEGLRRVVGA